MSTRNTYQRDLVLETVRALKSHPTPEEIYRSARERYPHISRGTVYRNLGQLAEDGAVLRIEVPNAPDRVDFNTEPHYHIICDGCGRVFDVALPYLDRISDMITDSKGFVIKSHDILFRGKCPGCNLNS